MTRFLSVTGAELRFHDYDRFVTALFAPRERREALFTLYAFAAALGLVKGPFAGHLRLQWWREVVSTNKDCSTTTAVTCGHPVAESLTPVIKRYRLDIADMLALVDAHADALDSMFMPNTESLLAHVTAITDPLTRLSLTVLGGGTGEESLALKGSKIAVAATLVRWLKAVPQNVAMGRIVLPLDRLRAAGITPEGLLIGQRPTGLATVVAEIAALATALLPGTRDIVRPPPEFIPLLLPAITITVDLARLRHSGFDLFNPRHALARPPLVRFFLACLLGRYDWFQNRNGMIDARISKP